MKVVPEGSPAVFLHSSWRTCSTWLWSRFRECKQTTAYIEIFHETLGSLNVTEATSIGPQSWNSRHPAGAPYFLEFLPILRASGGVAHYAPEMAFDRFLPPAGMHGNLTPQEFAYVATLINHARSRGTTPVLADTRTLGRVKSLRSAFGGVHIILYRNLMHQWASYYDQAISGNMYFINTIKTLNQSCQSDHFIKHLSTLYPLGDPDPENHNYLMNFLLFHIYFYTQSCIYSDLMIDIGQLANEQHYRRTIEDDIHRLTGIAPNLATVENRHIVLPFKYAEASRIEKHLDDGLLLIKKHVSLTHAQSSIAEKAMREFLQEFHRWSGAVEIA